MSGSTLWDFAGAEDLPGLTRETEERARRVGLAIAQAGEDFIRPYLRKAVETGQDLAYIEWIKPTPVWSPAFDRCEAYMATAHVHRLAYLFPPGAPLRPIPDSATLGSVWRVFRVREATAQQIALIMEEPAV